MNDDERRKNLETWWTRLSDEQRAELLPMEEGDPLPPAYVPDLTQALGLGPVSATWSTQGGVDFHVDERLSTFLEAKRSEP